LIQDLNIILGINAVLAGNLESEGEAGFLGSSFETGSEIGPETGY